MFIWDYAGKPVQNSGETGVLLRQFDLRANKTTYWPTVGGGVDLINRREKRRKQAEAELC